MWSVSLELQKFYYWMYKEELGIGRDLLFVFKDKDNECWPIPYWNAES